MIDFVVKSSGVFFLPQLALSVLTVALVTGYVISWARRELRVDDHSWQRVLEPIAGVAVGVGLLGSVVSFCVAFGGVKNGSFDVDRIISGLTTAYTTTAVGLVTGLIASFTSWALGPSFQSWAL